MGNNRRSLIGAFFPYNANTGLKLSPSTFGNLERRLGQLPSRLREGRVQLENDLGYCPAQVEGLVWTADVQGPAVSFEFAPGVWAQIKCNGAVSWRKPISQSSNADKTQAGVFLTYW